MTVYEELELVAESTQLHEVAESLHDIAEDVEAAAILSSKHCAEFDYIATKIAYIAGECDVLLGTLEKKEAE